MNVVYESRRIGHSGPERLASDAAVLGPRGPGPPLHTCTLSTEIVNDKGILIFWTINKHHCRAVVANILLNVVIYYNKITCYKSIIDSFQNPTNSR